MVVAKPLRQLLLLEEQQTIFCFCNSFVLGCFLKAKLKSIADCVFKRQKSQALVRKSLNLNNTKKRQTYTNTKTGTVAFQTGNRTNSQVSVNTINV